MSEQPFPKNITIGELYRPAMEIKNQTEADAYFERLIQHGMNWGQTRQEAETIQKSNLGYFAGYYDSKTRRRVERLFRCSHPIFGSIAENGEPSVEEAFEMGHKMASEKVEPLRKEE